MTPVQLHWCVRHVAVTSDGDGVINSVTYFVIGIINCIVLVLVMPFIFIPSSVITHCLPVPCLFELATCTNERGFMLRACGCTWTLATLSDSLFRQTGLKMWKIKSFSWRLWWILIPPYPITWHWSPLSHILRFCKKINCVIHEQSVNHLNFL